MRKQRLLQLDWLILPLCCCQAPATPPPYHHHHQQPYLQLLIWPLSSSRHPVTAQPRAIHNP
jgi:hypothetical protein